MTDPTRAELVARDTILKLLSNEELAKVTTAEAATDLAAGEEFIDLEHLDRGVQHAGAAAKVSMGNVLPRSALRAETWNAILAQLTSAARNPAAGVSWQDRLCRDRGFMTHFTVYLAVNALLIVIDLATSPGEIWFYWPLLGWGIGIAGHAYAVLQHPAGSPSAQRR